MDIHKEQEEVLAHIPVQGKTRFDVWCKHCDRYALNIRGVIGTLPEVQCQNCGRRMTRYYGNTTEMIINFGERSTHDEFERFRFRNLATGD